MIIGGYSIDYEKRTWILTYLEGDEFLINEGPSMTIARREHACAFDAKNQQVIVAGGGYPWTDSMESLDLSSPGSLWKMGPRLPFKVFGHQLIFHEKLETILFIGGYNYDALNYSEEIHKMERNGTWTKFELMSLITPRRYFVALSVPSNSWTC